MGIQNTGSLLHWNYFIALDSDVEILSRYVDFCLANYDAFSIEMAHILLASASEVDVVAKLLCKNIDATREAKNITQYRSIIRKKYPDILEMEVQMPRYGLTLKPWVNWKSNKSPDWWKDYNGIKHERDKYFSKANLKNMINAVAALYLILLYFYYEEATSGELSPVPRIFRIEDKYFRGIDIATGDIRFHYGL